jgi:hypothetical protein
MCTYPGIAQTHVVPVCIHITIRYTYIYTYTITIHMYVYVYTVRMYAHFIQVIRYICTVCEFRKYTCMYIPTPRNHACKSYVCKTATQGLGQAVP